jgi:hypothetical protein
MAVAVVEAVATGAVVAEAVDISRATLAVRQHLHRRNIVHRPLAMTTTAVAGMSPMAPGIRAGAAMVGRGAAIAEAHCQPDQLS